MAHPPSEHLPAAAPFSGQTVVFTGRLSSLGRREARALVRRLGGVAEMEVTARTTMLVVGAEGFTRPGRAGAVPSGETASKTTSNKLERARTVNDKIPGRVRILSEEEFCRVAGLRSRQALNQRYHSARRVRELYPLMTDARLRHLAAYGLVNPVARTNADTYYGFADVALIKHVQAELSAERPFRAVVRRCLAERSGQMALNFGTASQESHAMKVVALRRREITKVSARRRGGALAADRTESALAERFFLEGAELDEGAEPDRERARLAYRKALLLDPTLVPAIVNLANLHYAVDELVEAQSLYLRALSLEPDCFEAHFNLGNIHHDLGQYAEAVAYYTDALRLDATYADAHFYLAVTHEKMGQSSVAKEHWRAYQRLAPNGEWVDLAREFSD